MLDLKTLNFQGFFVQNKFIQNKIDWVIKKPPSKEGGFNLTIEAVD